ncbi:MAG: ROK family protein [Thermoguttaceae bacterium]|jgi:glucokinase|nr:ROK family protein [Thermoguttaceae bacterium]
MLLGIEIGGTKLQLGVGTGEGPPLAELARLDVRPEGGAEGIRRQIAEHAPPLIARHRVRAIGIGFGGPVDSQRGRTIVSHQVEGWKEFPLADWCRQTLGLPTLLANDSDSAGVAEARFGAGRGHRAVFYTNVGSGIGGSLVLDGHLYQGASGVASEIGHLRPGTDCQNPDQTVESLASGWAIRAAVLAQLTRSPPAEPDAADLLGRCAGHADRLTTEVIAQAAAAGNRLAAEAIDRACRTYGWAVAQVLTLLAPSVVVLGGGVSLMSESLWLAPLRRYVDQYVFPPLRGTFRLAPAQLGEAVVVHGALALARESFAA